MDRESALALLRTNHSFPGPFEFRVVVRPESVTPTVSAMALAGGDDSVVENVRKRESSKGTYVALRVRMRVPAAERVLDVYEILGTLDGILTSM